MYYISSDILRIYFQYTFSHVDNSKKILQNRLFIFDIKMISKTEYAYSLINTHKLNNKT